MMTKIRQEKPAILFLGSQMATGGAQHILLGQARWFYQQGYPVTAAFFYDKEGFFEKWTEENPFQLINLDGWRKANSPINWLRLIRALIKLSILLLRGNFTVIETFTQHANLLGLPLAWAAGVPVRIASHHGRVENFTPWMERLHQWVINSRITTGLVAVSTLVRQHAIDDEGIRPDKIEVIINGIDLSSIDALDASEFQARRQAFGVGAQSRLVLSVGRLSHPKGHTYLLDAIPEMIQQLPKSVFAIAGDGPSRNSLENKSKSLGIDGSVRFLGYCEDVPGLLEIADVFVLPSISEGLPVALLEAMWAGVPVVATNVGGVGEVIEDGRNGLLIPPADAKAISQSILRLLADQKLGEALGSAARTTIQERYSLECMCNDYEAYFSKYVR